MAVMFIKCPKCGAHIPAAESGPQVCPGNCGASFRLTFPNWASTNESEDRS